MVCDKNGKWNRWDHQSQRRRWAGDQGGGGSQRSDSPLAVLRQARRRFLRLPLFQTQAHWFKISSILSLSLSLYIYIYIYIYFFSDFEFLWELRIWKLVYGVLINWKGVEVEGLRVEEAYFRGRKLQGTTISLPQGFSGPSYIYKCNFYALWILMVHRFGWNKIFSCCIIKQRWVNQSAT